jgi:hypothetical protein
MKIKCDCTDKQGFSCKNCSRVRMVILLLPDHQNLKYSAADGSKINPAWYSPVKQNKWTNDYIVNGMIKRFMSNKLAPFTRKLQFYDQFSGNLIHESNR